MGALSICLCHAFVTPPIRVCHSSADMIFFHLFTLPDFQFPICDIVHSQLNSVNALNISNLDIFYGYFGYK